MSAVRVSRAVLRCEARLFARERASVFWIVAFPTLLVALVGAVPDFREVDPDLDGQRVVDLYVPIAALLSMMMAATMAMPPVLIGYRERGILRRLRTTPVPPGSLLLAQALLHGAAVAVSIVLVLGLGRIVYGTPLPASTVGYAVAAVLALGVSFSTGAVVAAIARTAKSGTTLATAVFFPSMFTAGLWVPVQAMDGLLRDVVGFTPLGAAAEALHDARIGAFPQLADVGIMAGWIVLLSLFAVRVYRWE